MIRRSGDGGAPIKVFCDGKELKRVIEVDDDAGYAIHVLADSEGKALHDGENWLTARVEGKITLLTL